MQHLGRYRAEMVQELGLWIVDFGLWILDFGCYFLGK